MASTESLKHNKTCVLRVSIHCEGCKRKVNKLLKSVPGVHNIQIDRQQQRVLVTGDVSPETLLTKLLKSGKHAELWPEITPQPQNHTRKTEKLTSKGESVASEKEIKPPDTKTEVPAVSSSKSGDSGVVPGGEKVTEGFGGKIDEVVGEKVTVNLKTEEKKPETGSAGNQDSSPVVEKKEKQTENDGGVVGGGGGGGEGKTKRKKKKEKEGQNGNKQATGEISSSTPQGQNSNKYVTGEASSSGTPPPPATTRSSNQSPPRQHGYKHPDPFLHAPVYTVSYNTAHPPVNSYTASYYAAPPLPPQSYGYAHFASGMATPPPISVSSSDYDACMQPPVDSFEMFSDENPNGCLIM